MSVQCIRLLGFDFIGIEIAIGIEIGFRRSIGGRISLDAVVPQSFVSKSHDFSISIAIPISIWIIPTCGVTNRVRRSNPRPKRTQQRFTA